MLYIAPGLLGARILLRSAFETLGILVYLNQTMRNVVAGTTDFHAFSETTTRLLLGSRDKSTRYKSINILTVFRRRTKDTPVSKTGMQHFLKALIQTTKAWCLAIPKMIPRTS
jgi:hypothetical protein